MFFLGQFQHNLDDKGRLMIPARFREMLDGGAYMTQGFDRCLMVMTGEYFRQVYADLNSTSLTDPNARILRRMILGNAFQLDIDKIGRVLVTDFVTPSWFGHAHRGKKMDFRGHVGRSFEILAAGYAQKYQGKRGWRQVNGEFTDLKPHARTPAAGSRRCRRSRLKGDRGEKSRVRF